MKILTTKLIPIISLLLVVGFLVTSLASYFVSRNSLRSEIINNELPLTSDNVYSEIQRDLLRPIFISSLMASDTFLRDWIIKGEENPEKITKYLSEIKNKFNTFTSFFVSEKTRNYYHAGGILKKVNPDEERDIWYFRVRDMKKLFEINIDPDMAHKDAITIFINYKVFDYNKNYIGATGVGLKVTAVKSLIENYQKKYDRNIYFIDKTGKVRLSGANFPKNIKNIFEITDNEYFAEKLNLEEEASFRYKLNGEYFHTNARYIPEFNWFLIVEQREGKATKEMFDILLTNLAICAGITLIIVLLVTLTIKRYQKNIETLRGILPICSYCKQVRDDKGYWKQVEAYVSQHSAAKFSHSICPTCTEKYYPGLPDDDKETDGI